MNEPLGIVEERQAFRDSVLSTARISPAARARILGKTVYRVPAKEHRIVVDMKAATRTVETTDRTLKPKALVPSKPRKRKRFCARGPYAAILSAVAEAWDVSVFGLLSAKRPARLFRPRFAAALILRERKLSFPQIGRALGQKDHTTAQHEVRRAAHLLHTDKEWAARYHEAKRLIEGAQK